jgi:DNA-binding SARP family transcriptional activator
VTLKSNRGHNELFPEKPVATPTQIPAVFDLLEAGQYERAAGILRTVGEAQSRGEPKDGGVVHIVSAAIQICLACRQCQQELEWHRQSLGEAQTRMEVLNQQLKALLEEAIPDGELRERPEASPPTAAPTNETPAQGSTSGDSTESRSLWQRFKSMFDLTLGSRLSEAPPLATNPDPPPTAADFPPAPPGQLSEPTQRAARVTPVEEAKPAASSPTLSVYCLGPFRAFQDEQPISEWPSSKGKAIFKYLVIHRKRPVPKEVLMDTFWRDADPESARNNLNVAIYGLRQALRATHPSYSHVLFQDDSYLFNPGLHIWLDTEAFSNSLRNARASQQHGDPSAALQEYCAAEALYQGDFLEEDRYEEWLIPQRQALRADYLSLLDWLSRYYVEQRETAACQIICRKMLVVDPCFEEAHRRLMRCYHRQGQPYLALRQYHTCVEIMKNELDASPSPKTSELYRQIRGVMNR